MTTFDLIDIYLFDYVSTAHRKELKGVCGCCSMVEEMNSIRVIYLTPGSDIKYVIGKCVCNRHGHQYCIPEEAVEKAVKELMKSKTYSGSPLIKRGKLFANFIDFEELYEFIKSVIGGISGIGPLAIYDTARRIGHLFDTPIYPKEYVYLAAGAKDAAAVLLNRDKNSLKDRESKELFSPYFGTLPSAFVEDLLCIFKGIMTDLGKKSIKQVRLSADKLLKSKDILKVV